MEKLKIKGEIKLVEIYRNKDDKDYYMILSCSIGLGKYGPDTNLKEVAAIQIPILESDYNKIKEELNSSNLENPHITINGELEMIIKKSMKIIN